MDDSEINDDSSLEEEKDIKPIILLPSTTKCTSSPIGLFPSSPKKWTLDSNRISAFQPYKQKTSCCTVLTNLQRGNTQAETPVPRSSDINFHTRAAQGEITEQDINNEVSVDVCDSNGLSALHWAAYYGQYCVVQLLLANGAFVNKLGPEEETPLILAASNGHHDVVKLLLFEGADVNHEDHLCNTALMYAAKGNHPHCCQEMLSHGANFSMVNLNDDTAYTIALENNSSLALSVIESYMVSRLEIALSHE